MDDPTDSPSPDTSNDPAAPTSQPKERHPTAPASKAERALKPLSAINLCLISLGIIFTLLGLSSKALHLSTITALDRATQDYEAARDVAVRKVQTGERLWELEDTQLTKHFWETSYEECLARGLNTADVHFLGRDYTEFDDVRNMTMVWVKTNCDRIFFTPETVKPKAVGKMAVWHRRLREHSAKIVDIVKNWLAQVPDGKNGWRTQGDSTTVKHTTPSASVPRYIYLPRGFRLVGCDTPPCQLAYTAPGNRTMTQRPQKTMIDAYENKESLKRAEKAISDVVPAVFQIWAALGRLQTLLLVIIFYVLTVWADDWPEKQHTVFSFQALSGYTLTEFVLGAVRRYLATELKELPFALGGVGRYITVELPLALGVIGILSFLAPNDIVPNICLFLDAMEELGTIFFCSHMPAHSKETPKLVPVVPCIHISPHTTLEEDVNITLEAFRAGLLDEAPGGEEQWEDFSPLVGELLVGEATDETSEENDAAVSHSSASSSLASEWAVVDEKWSA